jgi:hypothetical protein
MQKPLKFDIEAAKGALATKNFKRFVEYIKPDYIFKPFNEYIMSRLQDFSEGKVKKMMVFMPPQHGKQIYDNELVITTNGWKKHGDLIAGDYVYDRHGKPTMVIAISEKSESTHIVKFSDGSQIQCHENHEWVVYDKKKGIEKIVETKQLLNNNLRIGDERKRGNRYRFQIDTNVGVDFPERKLPLEPYVYGAWLGDGSKGKGCITHHANDNEVIDKIVSYGYEKGPAYVHKDTGVITTNFKELRLKIKETGSLDTKHIADIYLISSRAQRLELLAGLIDTDGYVYHKNGRVTFSNINKGLIDGVKELVISLGCRATICEFQPTKSTSGIVGKNIVYQLCFNPYFNIPTAIERKKVKNINPQKRKRAIISVEKAKKITKGNCIQVEGGVYLVGKNLIPTHNSTLTTRNLPAYILGKNPAKKILIASYSATVAHEFARDAKNIINSPEYKMAFPKTLIGKEGSSVASGSFADTAHYYQTPQNGFIYSVGRGGSLTSKTIDISIVDDPLKDRSEAVSQTVKSGLDSWYNDVVRTRLHNDSQELIILTRWVEDDIAGRLLKEEKDWEVIIFPAVKTGDYSEYDKREEGEPLLPEKHSLERLLEAKERNGVSFDSLYQQDPKPNKKLLVHPNFTKVDSFPLEKINKWIIGIDYGFNDHTAVVAIGCYENNRYWLPILYKPGKDIISEQMIKVGKFNDDIVDDILSDAVYKVIKAKGYEKSICYSEHHKVKIIKLHGMGLVVYLANKKIGEGIEKVNSYNNYYLHIDTDTHNEVSKYQFKSIGEVVLDEPVDGNDHIMNAGRYAIYTDSILYNH